MAITPIVYNLTPAADGAQRTNDPTGSHVPSLTLPTPTNLQVTATGQTTQTIAWEMPVLEDTEQFETQIATSDAPLDWQPAPTPIHDNWVLSVTYTGLATGTNYGHRVRAIADDGTTSGWAEI